MKTALNKLKIDLNSALTGYTVTMQTHKVQSIISALETAIKALETIKDDEACAEYVATKALVEMKVI